MDTNNIGGSTTILVTGGAGFIGSTLCDFLIEKKHQVICLDNFDDFYSEEIKLSNIRRLLNTPKFHLIKGDIRNSNLVEGIFSTFKIDCVVHLAAKAGVRASIDNISDYFDVNVNGTITLLESMRKYDVKNFIFSSSSSVYGNQNTIALEEEVLNKPISSYASSKITGELLSHNYYHSFDFKVINLRFFSVYGPRQRPDLVLHKFFNQIRNKKAITVYGNGTQVRDFTHVNDTIQAIYRAINVCVNSDVKLYETLNIGNNKAISLNEIIQLIQDYYPSKIEIEFNLKIREDVDNTCADISKAKEVINYEPKVSIKKGIASFHDWYNRTKTSNKVHL